MKKPQTTFIALLKGVNMAGHNKIPMAALREVCGELGWSNVQSYIQSGNLVFTAALPASALETQLERAIQERFSLSIHVVVRSATDWAECVRNNPFPKISSTDARFVALVLSKQPPKPGAVEALCERATADERVVRVGNALWIYFASGFARSKLSGNFLERSVGSPATARNWRTVLRLHELAPRIRSNKGR